MVENNTLTNDIRKILNRHQPVVQLDNSVIWLLYLYGLVLSLIMGGSPVLPAEFITKKIQLPSNWGQIATKYKNTIPTYIRY